MTIDIKTITLGKNIDLAYRMRPAKGKDTIVFIHGYGSDKEHFRHAFNSPSLENFTLIALDLIGFGQSKGPDEFGYSMNDQAAVIIELLDKLKIETFHLCGHSMGGLIVMEIAEIIPRRVLSLINMEGNLTLEDCFISGLISGSSYEEFSERGRFKLEEDFRNAGINDPSLSEYADTFSIASTIALYKSAYHTVEESTKPLVERFARIRNACYIYGEKNRGKLPGENLLHSAGVPIFYIDNSGHSMATENPEQLYEVIRAFVDKVIPA